MAINNEYKITPQTPILSGFDSHTTALEVVKDINLSGKVAIGYESQFATNHLGHFQLTLRLWPALRKAGHARVVSLSSTGVRFGGVDFDMKGGLSGLKMN